MIAAWIEKKLLKRAFADLSNRNLDKFLAAWADDAVFTYPGVTKASGVHRGKDEIRTWFEGMLAQFPDFAFTVQHVYVERIGDLTATNCLAAEWTIRGKSINGTEFENTGVTTIRFRLGKAVEVKDYIFDLELQRRAWA